MINFSYRLLQAVSFVTIVFIFACKQETKSHDAHGGMHDHTVHTDSTTHVASGDPSKPALYNEIMAVHDEIMPKMNDIEALQQEVRLRLDSIDQFGKGEKYRSHFRHAMVELNRSSDGMMQWMNGFNSKFDTISNELERNSYLVMERQKIEGVKMKMEESIKIAKLTIANTPLK